MLKGKTDFFASRGKGCVTWNWLKTRDFLQGGQVLYNKVELFDFERLPIRRVIDDQGNPLWVAKDVCEAFGDTNYRRSVSRLDPDEKGVSLIETPGGKQRMTVVTEPGLYGLLFNMCPSKACMKNSKIAQRVQMLEAFQDWVCGEVLPSIRKYGGYLTPSKLDEALSDPDVLIRLATDLKEEQAKRIEAVQEISVMAPKAKGFGAH